jgi:CubicO group peptidase (beta-lactamase class C family)
MKPIRMPLLICLAILLAQASIGTQAGVGGRWRAVLLYSNGDSRAITLQLTTDGTTLTGNVAGAPIRDGRLDGNRITFKTASLGDAAREATVSGELSGDEIVFSATGLVLFPIKFVARRDTRVELVGSVSDPALVHALMKQERVPGVSIAIIQDFKIVAALAYGVADAATGAPVTTETLFQAASISKAVAAMASLKAVQDGRFGLDQDINTILKSWTLPGDGFTNERPVTPRTLLSHTSGTGDGYGFLGYAPGVPLPTVVQLLDGIQPPSRQRPVRLERAPLVAYKYSGGGAMIQQLALTDTVGAPFADIVREWVFEPIGMAQSTFEQPLSAAREPHAARGHDRSGARTEIPWQVHPTLAAAGLWTTPADLARFAIEVQLSLLGRSNRVISQAMVREMVAPVGIGPWGVGFQPVKMGEGWYFMHTGSSGGYHSELVAHRLKGYGAVIMTNGDGGVPLLRQLRQLIQQEYKWDAL